MTHIYTYSDLSQVPLAQTWGMRYFRYPANQLELSSVNPYRLISVFDHFGANARLDNPPVPLAELQTVTIIGLDPPNSPQLPKWAADSLAQQKSAIDFLIAIKEWVQAGYNQMCAFQKRAGNKFLLGAPQHPEVRAQLSGLTLTLVTGLFRRTGQRSCQRIRRSWPPALYTTSSRSTSATRTAGQWHRT